MAEIRYARNIWYLAAWENEIPEGGTLARTLLSEPVAIFRTSSGDCAILQDRCPHRFAPLSGGAREGDTIACPYHGLVFDAAGACVRAPFDDRIPPRARVASYASAVRHGAIWFWPGDPALADPALIPDLAYLDARPFTRGRSHVNANYELLIDNVLDLTHVEFVHVATFGRAARSAPEQKTKDEGPRKLVARAVWHDIVLPPGMPDPGGPVAQIAENVWHAPSLLSLRLSWHEEATGRELHGFLNPHVATPETATTSHYFWTCDPTPEAEDLAHRVLELEDKPMLEAVQTRMGTADLASLHPIHLKADAPSIYARRKLAALIASETAASNQPAAELSIA